MDPVCRSHSGLDEFREHFRFRFEPVVEGAAIVTVVRPPKAVGALFNLPLHLEMILNGEFAGKSRFVEGRGGGRSFVLHLAVRLLIWLVIHSWHTK